MRRQFNRVIILGLFLLVNISSSYAGGGTRDVGLASAGWAARGQDAATLFRNPAAMSLFDQSQFLLGAQVLYGDFGFKPGPQTTVEGNDGGNPVGALPGGGLFYLHNTSEKVKLGLGAFSYFGLSQQYNEGWVGRYYIQEATLIGLTIMPSISYRASEMVSIGVGLNAMYGVFDQKIAINNVGPQADGQLALDNNTWGVGANVGILFEFNPQTRIGVDYLSQVSLDFKGMPQISGLGRVLDSILTRRGLLNSQLNVGIKVPHMVMASIYHEVDANLAVMGNIGWQNWKKFGLVDVTVSTDEPTSLTADLNFKDTWHVAAGAEWGVAEKWDLTAGFAYDSSPVENQDRPIALPIGKIYRFAIGTVWDVSDPINLGVAYEMAFMGNLPVDQFRGDRAGRVQGVFSDSAIHFFAFNFEWNLN
jgi:long-chain fatty acid transport protein